MWWTALVLVAIVIAVRFVHRSFTFWKRLNFPEIKPQLIIGNLKPVVKGERSFGVTIYELYKQSSASPFVGIYLFFRPALLVNDIVLVKNVLNNDFHHFHDRGVYNHVNDDPLSGGIFQLDGLEWKNLRTKMTPAFSSAKLKNMFKTFHDIGTNLERHMSRSASNGGYEAEMKDLLSRYIADIVASTIFGFEVNTIENPKHDFRDVGRSFTNPNLMNGFRNAGFFLWPRYIKSIAS